MKVMYVEAQKTLELLVKLYSEGERCILVSDELFVAMQKSMESHDCSTIKKSFYHRLKYKEKYLYLYAYIDDLSQYGWHRVYKIMDYVLSEERGNDFIFIELASS